MTRTGKIARLPGAVRSRLNQQLTDGVPGVRLVKMAQFAAGGAAGVGGSSSTGVRAGYARSWVSRAVSLR
jgi:hypothetical protein